MSAWATPRQLAGLPGLPASERRCRDALASMGLPARPRQGRGGGFEYQVAALPEPIRIEFLRTVANTQPALNVAANEAALASVPNARSTAAEVARQSALVTGWRKDRQDARARLLVCFQRFWAGFGGPLTPALEAFCQLFPAGKTEAPAELVQQFPKLSVSRLRGWHVALQAGGLGAITPPEHHRRGRYAALEGEVGKAVLALLTHKPHISAKAVFNVLQTQFEALPSERAFRRALTYWKSANKQLFAAVTSPDAWRSKYLAAAGSASAGITRPNQLWEMDSTSGDVLLADGKRHAVVGVIDVFTRRRMFLICRTSKAAAIMALVRRAIEAWGVPEAIKTDNGRDYTARQFDQALLGLGIEHPLCPPFTPQAKPHIERAIGALMVQHFELLEGFIGHSVAQRKDIESRRSFADQLFGEESGLELRLTPEQLQAGVDAYCERLHRESRDELRGRTPEQMALGHPVATVSERALDVLLSPEADGGMRVVGKKGIRAASGGYYNAGALGGMEGTSVQVRVDEANLGRAWVFDRDGVFICEAIDHERLGISAAEVAAERRAHQARVLRESKKALRLATRSFDTRAAIAAVTQGKVEAAIEAAPNVVALRQSVEHRSVAVDSVNAARAAQDLRRAEAKAALEDTAPAAAPVMQLTNPKQRYSAWVRLTALAQSGQALSQRDAAWVRSYEGSDEWAGWHAMQEGVDPLDQQAGGAL